MGGATGGRGELHPVPCPPSPVAPEPKLCYFKMPSSDQTLCLAKPICRLSNIIDFKTSFTVSLCRKLATNYSSLKHVAVATLRCKNTSIHGTVADHARTRWRERGRGRWAITKPKRPATNSSFNTTNGILCCHSGVPAYIFYIFFYFSGVDYVHMTCFP